MVRSRGFQNNLQKVMTMDSRERFEGWYETKGFSENLLFDCWQAAEAETIERLKEDITFAFKTEPNNTDPMTWEGLQWVHNILNRRNNGG